MQRLALAALVALSLVPAGCTEDGEVDCPAGQTACGGVCFDLQTDPLSCGRCLRVCAEGATCEAGVCRCPAGQSVCDGACVDLQIDPTHCGSCGQACGLGTCDAGACACAPLAIDCDGNPACVDLQSDPSHCGACGERCLARGFCDGGACACPAALPETCPASSPTYCASFASTTDCGGCGVACAAGGLCDAGACDCPGAQEVCGETPTSPGACTDLATDEANCGGCGVRCATGATCAASDCVCPAAAPDLCGAAPGACVNRQTDEANCGLCGRVCAPGASCTAGACVCPAARPELCGTQCCAGDQCCGTAGTSCQPPHQNGLGNTYFSGCDAPYTPSQTTEQAALRAADAWGPGLTLVGTTGCDVLCLGRQTSSSCAVWCYGFSPLAGRVGLNTINNSCAAACPGLGSPGWN